MNRRILPLLGAAIFAASVFGAESETRLMRFPDISATQVVFSYAGDLWSAPRNGGSATRLTAHSGDELYPKFSPDGKWIAFTGEYDGNADVYVMPSSGGEPRRLTFHPANDMVLGWTPDGKRILFRSNRNTPYGSGAVTQLYTVSPEGGQPEQLPMKRGSLASYSPDGKKIAYTPTSIEFRTWKRYRGGWMTYIGMFDLTSHSWEQLPKVDASDIFPMWYENSIYFASDRDGIMNLYRYDVATKKTKQVTNSTDFDVEWPSLGANAVVYQIGGKLQGYDIKKAKTFDIPISVPSDLAYTRPELKAVAGHIRSMSLSPSGKRVLVEARGDILTLPVEHGSPRTITETSDVHELDPTWSPDGKWIAYLSDKSGEYELYIKPQNGGDETRVTTDGKCYRYNPQWSPDSKKIAFTDKTLRLWYVDINDKKPVQVDKADYNQIRRYDWSPDSKWIAYQKAPTGSNEVVYLYSLDQKNIVPVTDAFYNSYTPKFDPTGKYLYFLSDRFYFPSNSDFDNRFLYHDTTGIFGVTLQSTELSPFGPQSDEEAAEKADKETGDKTADKKDGDKKDGAATASAEKKDDSADKNGKDKAAAVKPVKIDLEGLSQRIFQVPVNPGNYNELDARGDNIFFMSRPNEAFEQGRPGPPKPQDALHIFDTKKRTDKVVLQGINGYDLDKKGTKVLYRAAEMMGVVDAAPDKKVGDGRIKTEGVQVMVDPRAEWKQMLHEAWRLERDFYWDPAMGGLDWEKVGKRYEDLLPWVAHRSDLNYLIGDMIAELNTSHAYVSGGEMPDRKRVGVGLLGVDFAPEGGFFKIAKIYRGENWTDDGRSPLTEPGVKVKEGNYLIAVNGRRVSSSEDPYAYFQGLAGQLVTLKVNDKASETGAWDITVNPIASEAHLRYLDWVESNRRYVEKATGGRVAYMHVPNTAIEGIQMFDKYLNAQLEKQALIVDERYNGGGFIPDFFTEKLQRKLLAFVSPREGKDVAWPPVAIHGPKVMLVNEMAGSGGDCFPWFFQRLKLGPVVGTRTWGGLVGITGGEPMIDGGRVTAPEFAFWAVDKQAGEWIVENHGVDPDYVVDQRPDREMQGHDPQLDKAIELVMASLKAEPPLPSRPKYPIKALPSLQTHAKPQSTGAGSQ